MTSGKTTSGFTLIELAIVVAIVGMVLTAGVRLALTQMEYAAISSTKKKQETIKQALITYLGKNRRLPCPDTAAGNGPPPPGFTIAGRPDGIENRAVAGNPATACASAYGVLPYAELGLPQEFALDGWENYFSYHISIAQSWHRTAAFADTNVGTLVVSDRPPPDPPGNVVQIANNVVAIVISYGSNGSGAFNIQGTQNALPVPVNLDELANALGPGWVPPAGYLSRQPTNNTAATGGAFDDWVMFLTADDLLAPLRRDGSLRSQIGSVNDQLAVLRNAVVGFMGTTLAGGCMLPADLPGLGLLPTSLTTDPWGVPFVVARQNGMINAKNSTPPAGDGTALLLYSAGPNRVDDGGIVDDISMKISLSELKGILGLTFGATYFANCP